MAILSTIGNIIIYESDGHGKSTRGNKKTSTIQVRKKEGEGYLLMKQYSFSVFDFIKKRAAIKKATEYAATLTETP